MAAGATSIPPGNLSRSGSGVHHVAGYLPARRAASIDPMRVLNTD